MCPTSVPLERYIDGELANHQTFGGMCVAPRGREELHMGSIRIPVAVTILMTSMSMIGCKKGETDRPALQPTSDTAPSTGTATTTSSSGSAASAQEAIAESRCAREQNCGNIGENKKYSSQQDCLARIRADWKDDLNSRACPNGTNQTQLNECLKAIRDEECGNLHQGTDLQRMNYCVASGVLC